MTLRVDFHSRYIRPKGDPPHLPGQPVNGKKHFTTFGLLDTGSVWTVVGTKYADALGITYASAPQIQIIGLGKTLCTGYEVDLKLVLKVASFS